MNAHTMADITTVNLPKPMSVNAMYANVRGKGRIKSKRYNVWTLHARDMLQDQQPLPTISSPVHLAICVGEKGINRTADIDNMAKCLIDALVSGGVLSDDKREVVRGVTIAWVPDMTGAQVRIIPAAVSIRVLGKIG